MELLLTSQAAKKLGISPQGVRLLEREGKLPAVKTAGGVRIFTSNDVDQLAKQRTEKNRDQKRG